MSPILLIALGAAGALLAKPVWHSISHQHETLAHEDIGTLVVCHPRWGEERIERVSFKPNLVGASWRKIPPCAIEDVLDAEDPGEALAMIAMHRDCRDGD